MLFFGAESLYKTLCFFPFYAFTLRFLVPRCCRVTLQPGLNGKNSYSFLGLQGAQTLFLNPTAAAASDPSIGATANGGAENLQEPQAISFLIRMSLFRSVRHQPIG